MSLDGLGAHAGALRTQGRDACIATQRCRWQQPKPKTAPNGVAVELPGGCTWKPGFKAAFTR